MASPYVLVPPPVSFEPFPYFQAAPVIQKYNCDELFTWLSAEAPWRYHQECFYQQMECDLLTTELTGLASRLFDPEALAELVAIMEASFGEVLDQRLSVVAHKLLPGYQINIHNDAPDPGMETHRLVLQLNPHGVRPVGGDLVLFRSRSEQDVHATFAPDYNTAVAFALSDRSYHAVTPVETGVRYTVVYSFWTKDSAEEARRRDASLDGEAIKTLVSILQAIGANRVAHSDRTLLDHLLGTCELLRAWGCRQAVCVAGLFHSVYGTESLTTTLVRPEEPGLLCGLIGPEAEELVHLFGTTARLTLFERSEEGCVLQLRSTRADDWLTVTPQQAQDLLAISAANFVEQAARAEPPFYPNDPSVTGYQRLAGLLPERARGTLARLGAL